MNIKVACVTDRDVMPDCAPHICINEKYTSDSTSWPKQEDRNWRAESDFTPEQADSHNKNIKQKADGQQVLTFIADHWTLEYDLAYVSLSSSLARMKTVPPRNKWALWALVSQHPPIVRSVFCRK